MAKINYEKYQDDSIDLYGILLGFCGLICMVSAILGIKFKWFKHRLNFENSINELNSTSTNSTNNTARTEIFRSTANVTYKATPFEVGVFRQKADNEFDFETPKSLPPIIVKSSTQVKLPNKLKHPQQQSTNTLFSTSYKEDRIDKNTPSEVKNPIVNNSKLHTSHSSNKNKQDRSNLKSPRKDRHNHNHHSHQTSKEIENKRHHEKSSTDKILLTNTSDNSKIRTKQLKEKSEQNFTQKPINPSKHHQMENKKNIKKKIKFDATVNENKSDHSANFQRRPTGFTKLSKEELEELEALSEQGSPTQEKLTRRATGFELLSKEEFDELEDIANNNNENSIEKKLNSMKFHDFEEEDNNPLHLKFNREFSKTTEKENEYGFISNEKNNKSADKVDLNNYPGVIKQENDDLIFKITGFSDNEEDDTNLYSSLKINTEKNNPPSYKEEKINNDKGINFEDQSFSVTVKPEPQPRTSLRHSKDNETDTINNTTTASSLMMTTSNNESKIEQEEDSWSAVRNYRNITEEMAKHNQAIREAAKEKAARRELRNPLAYDEKQNDNSTKPKNMKDVKRRQHENEEREKKINQKVSLNNDNNDEDSEISC